jgi:ADP-heptose:LPS heptosyltransferase
MVTKLILECGLSPGDIVMLTGAVRDIHKAYPGRYLTDLRTSVPEIWDNNPYVTTIPDSEGLRIDCEYPLINNSSVLPYHFIHGFIDFLNRRLGLQITPTEFRGDIHLSELERRWASQIHELSGEDTPFWLVAAGGKHDVSIKWWETERYQKIVDHFRGRILFVQVGNHGHHHPKLHGAVDLRGKTTFRELIRLVHHAQGVLSPVTCLMHLAAAVPNRWEGLKPCVVLAGGREPAHWEQYPGHQFLHTIGSLDCCRDGGCWKDRTVPLGDESHRDAPDSLCQDVVGNLPRCMSMITPEKVISAIEGFFGRMKYLTPAQIPGAKRAIRRTRTNPFEDLPLTLGNARMECERFIRAIPEPQRDFHGRGIVICAGGVRYFTCVWVCIHRLRRAGCSLPIEVWYLGASEMTPQMIELLTELGVTCMDASEMRKRYPCRQLNGWELKAYAVVYSSFAEVLFLDADNVAVKDPEFLFDSPEYVNHGAVFWPDYGHFENTAKAWTLLGMEQPSHPEFESGQMLIDKTRCWRPLRLALWLNEHSDLFYRLLHGDKETFHLAWRKLGQPFHFITTPIQTLGWTMCQHDPKGERLFQHRNTDKWSLHGTNPVIEDFWFEEECRGYLSELRQKWDGNASQLKLKPPRKRLPTLSVVMLSSEDRADQRQASLEEWRQSDAGHIDVQVLLRKRFEDPESVLAFQAIEGFVSGKSDYLLILGDDIQVASSLLRGLDTWSPWITGEIGVGSLYHPGSSEKICDVRTRTDWVPIGSFLAELGVLVSRRAARRVAQTWNELEAPWPTRVAQLSLQKLVAFHNPSLIQHACRKAVDGVPHEARNFLRDWMPPRTELQLPLSQGRHTGV